MCYKKKKKNKLCTLTEILDTSVDIQINRKHSLSKITLLKKGKKLQITTNFNKFLYDC